jgi:hypothetical protein
MVLAIGSFFALAGPARSQPARVETTERSSKGAPTTPNQLTAIERSAGWTLLFDGRTLTGWRGLGGKKSRTPKAR